MALIHFKDDIALPAKGYGKVFAGPISGTDVPSWRALVMADIPDLSWTKITSGKPTTLAGYGITDAALATHNHTLDSLSNVSTADKDMGDLIQWDGSEWVAVTLAEAGVSGDAHTHNYNDILLRPAAITAIENLPIAADRIAYYTGTSNASLTSLTALGRNVIGSADAAGARSVLELGALAIKTTIANADVAAGAAIEWSKISKVGSLPSDIGTYGVAGLDADGKINPSVLPALAITDTFVAADETAMLALSLAERGDVAVRTDLSKTFILKGDDYSVLADWQELLTPTDTVLSVDGRTGVVVLDDLYADIAHVHAWTEITGKPVFASVATSGSYTDLINKPTTFTPSNHASTHAPGGTDAVFPANSAGFLRNNGSGAFTWEVLSSGDLPDSYLPLSGGTMEGSINMDSYDLTNIHALKPSPDNKITIYHENLIDEAWEFNDGAFVGLLATQSRIGRNDLTGVMRLSGTTVADETNAVTANAGSFIELAGGSAVVPTGSGSYRGGIFLGTQPIIRWSATEIRHGRNSTFDFPVDIKSSVTLGDSLTGHTTTFDSRVSSNLEPNTNGTRNLGAAAYPWATLYATTVQEGGQSLASKYLGIGANAVSASAWQTARTVTLSGDLTGNTSIDGSQDVTLNAQIASGSIVDADISATAAIDPTKIDLASMNPASIGANGVAGLDAEGKIAESVLPDLAITDTFVVADETEMLALAAQGAQKGDVAVRSDEKTTYILKTEPASVLANWVQLGAPTDGVLSVDGETGAVDLSDTYAPLVHTHAISDVTNLQTALDGKSNVGHSHAISDVTNLQTTLDAKAALVHTHEISQVTGLQTSLNSKLDKTGGTLTGNLVMPTNDGTLDPTQVAYRDSVSGEIKFGQVLRRYTATFGDASTYSFIVAHNLGTEDVVIQAVDTATKAVIYCDVVVNDPDYVTLTFQVAPGIDGMRVTIIG